MNEINSNFRNNTNFSNNNSNISIDDIAEEVLVRIFSFLENNQRQNVCRVSKKFNRIASKVIDPNYPNGHGGSGPHESCWFAKACWSGKMEVVKMFFRDSILDHKDKVDSALFFVTSFGLREQLISLLEDPTISPSRPYCRRENCSERHQSREYEDILLLAVDSNRNETIEVLSKDPRISIKRKLKSLERAKSNHNDQAVQLIEEGISAQEKMS